MKTLRVEITTIEGAFDNVQEEESCLNICPDCGGASGSGSGSGSGEPPAECPTTAWFIGYHDFYCTGAAPFPPPIDPFNVDFALLAGICSANDCGQNHGCDTTTWPTECQVNALVFQYVYDVWIRQGKPDVFPTDNPDPQPTPANPSLLVEFTEYDVPDDVKIVDIECIDVPLCSCDSSGVV